MTNVAERHLHDPLEGVRGYGNAGPGSTRIEIAVLPDQSSTAVTTVLV